MRGPGVVSRPRPLFCSPRQSCDSMSPRFIERDASNSCARSRRTTTASGFEAARTTTRRIVKAPMIAVIEQLAKDFRRIAPSSWPRRRRRSIASTAILGSAPTRRRSRRNAAAVFPWKGLARHQARDCTSKCRRAGCGWAAGMYSPETPQLVKVREHIVDTWPEIKKDHDEQGVRDRVATLHGEADARAARVSGGSSGGRVPQAAAISRQPRVPCRALRRHASSIRR